ncbi:MAG: nucleotide exchange factor GrpE [Phycisphaerales bacterium]|nr:nucleotide exchange factor GrpE [Phycisphaerales bacterium]
MFGKPRNKPDSDDASNPVDPDSRDGGELEGDMEDVQQRIEAMEAERDEARNQALRCLADFQNFQRRALQNEVEAKRQGVTSVLHSVLPVLDHFDLALTQATPDEASRRIMDGVRVIRQELVRALESHGVALISPQPNDPFDPNRHSAIMQQPADGVESGNVSACFQPGYALGDRVIRSAKVAVAP